jgi:hypothetical protein
MDNNPSKFFDKILSFLASDYNKIFTIEEVKNFIYKKQIVKISKSKDFFMFSDKNFETNTINAVMFLNREGLVAYNEKEKQVFINSKGFVKYKTENFTQEIRNKSINLWLQRGTWLCSILALFFSFYSAFLKSESFPTIVLDCNHTPSTTATPFQPNSKPQIKKEKELTQKPQQSIK